MHLCIHNTDESQWASTEKMYSSSVFSLSFSLSQTNPPMYSVYKHTHTHHTRNAQFPSFKTFQGDEWHENNWRVREEETKERGGSTWLIRVVVLGVNERGREATEVRRQLQRRNRSRNNRWDGRDWKMSEERKLEITKNVWNYLIMAVHLHPSQLTQSHIIHMYVVPNWELGHMVQWQ